jgi:hypothetical protein
MSEEEAIRRITNLALEVSGDFSNPRLAYAGSILVAASAALSETSPDTLRDLAHMVGNYGRERVAELAKMAVLDGKRP